ncbi:unnamed protein product [Lymnaea stagnalis]|uniref:28S ribosomal protein S34, mitochondrial n=1 Tax=Lymnaea stagnalis TaxID=6523 RepID=A0AAV2H9U1_LYMST
MPIRYIGREPFHKGKSLFEICRQLRDLGVGRVVYRKSFALKWPTQLSYYRLTQVTPDMTCKEFCKGTAWGQMVFRGKETGLAEITSGHKFDWILVPKEEEEEYCKSPEVFDVDKIAIPKYIACPPLLEIVLKQEIKAKGMPVPEKIQIPFYADEYKKEITER